MYYFCISFIILPNTSKVPLFGVETSIFLARLKPVAGVLVVVLEFTPVREVALFVGGILVGVAVAGEVTTQAEAGGGFVDEESFEGVAMLRGKFLFLSWLDSVDVVVDVPDEDDDDDDVPFRICLMFSVEWSFDKLPFLLEPGTNLKL